MEVQTVLAFFSVFARNEWQTWWVVTVNFYSSRISSRLLIFKRRKAKQKPEKNVRKTKGAPRSCIQICVSCIHWLDWLLIFNLCRVCLMKKKAINGLTSFTFLLVKVSQAHFTDNRRLFHISTHMITFLHYRGKIGVWCEVGKWRFNRKLHDITADHANHFTFSPIYLLFQALQVNVEQNTKKIMKKSAEASIPSKPAKSYVRHTHTRSVMYN